MPPSLAIHELEVPAEPVGPRPASDRSGENSHDRISRPLLGEALFKDALLRERRRSDRVGTPFAVLLVDRGDGSSREFQWAPLLQAVAAVKRDVDVVGWLDRGEVLGLLLAEASGAGALKVLERVRREIRSRLGDSALAALSLRLYTHADPTGSESAPFAPADLLTEAFVEEWSRSWHDVIKRPFDILGSLALLVLFAPVFLMIFLAVKLGSPGPALFRQVRIGWRGRPFTMLKFRTMSVDGGDEIHRDYATWFIKSSGREPRTGDEVFKLTHDPRVTRLGRVLRKTSLDELPQLWNALRGEMSLVGPRPPLPFEVEQYQPWHRRRVLEAKPGITGPWQVNGRSRATFEEMVRMDLHYVRTHSLWNDVKILAATPRAMISGKGAC